MAWVAVGTTAASIGSQWLMNGQQKKANYLDQYSPQQLEAMGWLNEYGKTGKMANSNYTPGQAYSGPLGNYDMTGLERQGQGQLSQLMNAGSPEMMGIANQEIKNTLGSTYDPYNDKGAFKGFKQSLMKELGDSKARLNRDLSAGGNYWSSARGRNLGDLEANANNAITSKLGELYDSYAQRRQNMIPLAMNAATTGENIAMGRIGASQQYGGLSRNLADAKAKDAYGAWMNTRKELSGSEAQRVAAMGSLAGNRPTYQQEANGDAMPWGDMLGSGIGLLQTYLGNRGGGKSAGNMTSANPKLNLYRSY